MTSSAASCFFLLIHASSWFNCSLVPNNFCTHNLSIWPYPQPWLTHMLWFKLKPWFEQKPCFCIKTVFYTKKRLYTAVCGLQDSSFHGGRRSTPKALKLNLNRNMRRSGTWIQNYIVSKRRTLRGKGLCCHDGTLLLDQNLSPGSLAALS